MLRISNFKLPLQSDEKKLPELLAAALGEIGRASCRERV